MDMQEKTIVKCTPHWFSFAVPGAFCIFFLIISLNFLVSAEIGPFILSLIIAGAFVLAVLGRKTSSLILTDNAVIGKVGIIKTKKLTSPLSKVQDVSVSSGFLGKIFKYSTVCVSTAGSSGNEYEFKHMKNGELFQSKFLELSK